MSAHPQSPAAPSSSVAALLRFGAQALEAASDSPRRDAEILLGSLLNLSRSALLIADDAPIDAARHAAYHEMLARRRRGEPVAYVTGSREFWSLDLKVSPAVLVPRPETELLVELALAALPRMPAGSGSRPSLLDLGTGSGAVALAVATERPDVLIVAVDVSPAALEVARSNARDLEVTSIEWRCGSWFGALDAAGANGAPRRFDVIVGNPPYIAADDPALQALASEPRLALVAGTSGLEALAAIVAGAGAHLATGGHLLLEHGHTQGEAVATLFAGAGFCDVRNHRDLAGNPRVTTATLGATSPIATSRLDTSNSKEHL